MFCCIGACTIRSDASQKNLSQQIAKQLDAGELDSASEAARQAWQRDPNSEWGWTFKGQYLLTLLYRGDLAKAERTLQDEVPAKYPKLTARYQYLRAYLAFLSRKPAAPSLAESTRLLAIAQGDATTEAEVLILEARLYDDRQLALLRQALLIAQQNHLTFLEADALSEIGLIMHDHERYSDAISYLLQAAPKAAAIDARLLGAVIMLNLGECYLNLGDLDQAMQSLQKARSQLHTSDPPSMRADVNVELGKVSSLRRENPEAIRYFRDAFAIVQHKSALDSYVPTTQKLAAGLIEEQQLDEAEKFNELSHESLKGNRVSSAYQTAFYNLNRADLAAQRNDFRQAESMYRNVLRMPGADLANLSWLAHAHLAELEAKLVHVSEARRNFEDAVTAIEENRSQQKATEHQITFLSALIRFYQQYVEFLVKQGNRHEALAVADSSRASVLTQGLQSSRKEPDFMARVRREARESNSALLFYWLAPQKSYLWVITPQGDDLKELPGETSITQDVKDYSKTIQAADEDPLSAPNPVGVRLYETLVGPVSSQIKKGMRVVVVPDGALHGLNFETLIVKGDKPHYWLDDVSVTVAPSLRILLAKSNVVRHSASALIIGDGDYSGAGDKYPPLPESKEEVADVSAFFPTGNRVITQRQAVPEAYQQAHPGSFSLIHFSAHVEANENSPLDSAIILSPGKYGNRELYARDLMKSPINADLVTISGCNSVGKKALAGEGLVGFAWAAFEAGARNAVTSLWEVDDRSTTELMGRFYAEVTQGKSYAVALRDAKLQMLNGNFKKPYYWAPFQLYSRNLE